MTTKSKMRKVSSTQRSRASKKSSSPISQSKLTDTLANSHAGLVFIRRFQNSLARTKVLPRGSKIIVAVSGGPDSIALLHLLARLRKKHGFRLRVTHVNYGLRGRDSDRDEALVQKVALSYALPCSVLHSKIQPTKNVEATLRDIRYGYFEKLRRKFHFDCIVTAHTLNDVAETFLMNLMRGAGLTGLAPFQRTNARLVRPLLDFQKTDILRFLEHEKITYRIDRSNLSRRFTRNRIRHDLLPLLETFNPSIIETLAATARRLGSIRRR